MDTAIAIFRQRGQLIIPAKIRNSMSWTQTDSVVSISKVASDKLVIEPAHKTQKVDWKTLRAQLKRVSSYKGRGRGNLSQFIIEDRERH